MNIFRVMTAIRCLLCLDGACAKVAMPKWFGDNMVLQTNKDGAGVLPVLNGKANPDERVQVDVVAARTFTYTAQADAQGDWKVQLEDVDKYNKKHVTIHVSSSDEDDDSKVTASQTTFGDVFFCSGQSNMAYPLNLAFNPKEEAETLKQFPNFNFFVAKRSFAKTPQWTIEFDGECDIDGHHACDKWVTQEQALQTDTGESESYISQFSAVCFMTVREIAKMRTSIGSDRPVGLVQVAWSGTRVEAWMSKEALQNVDHTFLSNVPTRKDTQNETSVLYNGMVHPWKDYAIRAVLWFQGESNAKQGHEYLLKGGVDSTEYYAAMYEAMIADWRKKKGLGDFAWGAVQLPPTVPTGTDPQEQSTTGIREIRIAQAQVALKTGGSKDNSALAVTLDLGGSGKWKYKHPPNKNEIARRLALVVLHAAYGTQTPLWTGPVLEKTTREDDALVLEFSKISSSNMKLRDVKAANINGTRNDCTKCCANGPPFEVQIDKSGLRSNSNWVTVARDAITIQDQSVVLTMGHEMDRATAVRYAWTDYVECVLENSEGLVAGPFLQQIDTSEFRQHS